VSGVCCAVTADPSSKAPTTAATHPKRRTPVVVNMRTSIHSESTSRATRARAQVKYLAVAVRGVRGRASTDCRGKATLRLRGAVSLASLLRH
jgi:hypothetical protein